MNQHAFITTMIFYLSLYFQSQFTFQTEKRIIIINKSELTCLPETFRLAMTILLQTSVQIRIRVTYSACLARAWCAFTFHQSFRRLFLLAIVYEFTVSRFVFFYIVNVTNTFTEIVVRKFVRVAVTSSHEFCLYRFYEA